MFNYLTDYSPNNLCRFGVFHPGTLELCMRYLLIQCLTVDKLFTLNMLNERLSVFHYGPDVTNKPTQLSLCHITATGHIKQSGKEILYCYYEDSLCIYNIIASQMWCLARFLPVLIGDKIPETYPYWENFLAQLEIIDEIFAPIISEDRLEYIIMLIEDYLVDFRTLYTDRKLTPKMHYLLHVPTWIKRYVHIIHYFYHNIIITYTLPLVQVWPLSKAMVHEI